MPATYAYATIKQLVFKERLGEHVPAANTPQQLRGCVLYLVRVATIGREWYGKHD
jgi:hypothetical protein